MCATKPKTDMNAGDSENIHVGESVAIQRNDICKSLALNFKFVDSDGSI